VRHQKLPADFSPGEGSFGGEALSAKLTGGGSLMDQRIESFLADILALAGEDPDAVHEGVRVALTDCEHIFRAQETHKRMTPAAHYAALA
jgi:hypothetical protein